MRHVLGLTLAASLTVSTAFAQSAPQPQMDVTVIHQDSFETNQGIFVPIFAVLIALIAVAASADGGSSMYVSDERLKEDIVRVGTSEAGYGIYEWSYIGSDQRFRGVLAQDVLNYRPDAVISMAGGYLAVDYDALGFAMEMVD